jgi:hypothetical protein
MSVLTAAQICSLARETAKCPGYQTQSGQLLNVILEELAQDYDFDVIKSSVDFSFNSVTGIGSGPYTLPANWYRGIDKDVFYTINGVPYPMVNITLTEYHNLVQQSGLASYPTSYATDMSQSPPVMYVWPPASGGFPVHAGYFKAPTSITTPETSTDIPWFPSTQYLLRRLAGELMTMTNDDRVLAFLGDADEDKDTPGSACSILRKYLKMKDDQGGKVHTVQLDRRHFGRNFSRLPNTKTIGW